MDWLRKLFRFGGSGSVTVTDSATATILTEEQAASRLVVLSGTLTAAREVVLPHVAGADWLVRNATSGGRAVTVRGSTGSGVVVPAGETRHLVSDGTAIVAMDERLVRVSSDRWGQQQQVGVYSLQLAGSGWETLATINPADYAGDGYAMTLLVSADVHILSDDGGDADVYALKRSFHWNSVPSARAVGPLVKVLEHPELTADARIDLSGTSIVVQVSAASEFRAAASVSMSLLRFV